MWQWFGIGGDDLGSNGFGRRTLGYGYLIAAVAAGVVGIVNVITSHHDQPQLPLALPIAWEGTSWTTLIIFLWIPWAAFRVAPLSVQPRARLWIHAPAVFMFSAAHVLGFILLRKLLYWLAGEEYAFGPLYVGFWYEFAKDLFTYTLFFATFTIIEHLLRRSSTDLVAPAHFDIRDGAKLTRVRIEQILAVASAGNYVEFLLSDARRLLMRSSLSAVESELAPSGFVRTHRSWLVNTDLITGLKPEGSGDYTVELGVLTVPLSRRFPNALAQLRGRGASLAKR